MGGAPRRALPLARFTPVRACRSGQDAPSIDCGGAAAGATFAAERADEDANVFDAAVRHIRDLQAAGRRVIVAGVDEGSRERLGHVLADHGLRRRKPVARTSREALALPAARSPSRCCGLEAGFETGDFAVIGEQDILGDRLVRPKRQAQAAAGLPHRGRGARRPAISSSMSTTASAASTACKTIEAAGAPHDCLEIHYAGGDRLFLPVENIELLTALRLGGDRGRSSTGSAAAAGRRARRG